MSLSFNMWAAAAAMASALPKGVSGSVEMRLGANFVSAEDERVVLIVELDLGLPLLLSAEAERLGRGVVFLVLTGVFLKVWEGVFLRSLRTMRPPMELRRRPARCGVVFVAAGMVCHVLAVPRVAQRGAAARSRLFGPAAFKQFVDPREFRGADCGRR